MKKIAFITFGLALAGLLSLATPAIADCGSCGTDSNSAEGTAKHECTGENCELCAEHTEAHAAAAEATVKPALFWANEACPVMGGQIMKTTAFVMHANEKENTYAKIYTCCPGCEGKVKENTAAAYRQAYLSREIKNDEGKVVVKKGEPVALANKTCPISGKKISSTQYHLVYNGVKVNLCCPGCEKAFMKAPDKNLTSLVLKEELKVPGKKVAQLKMEDEKSAATQTN
jgi:hypothetical protein